MQNIKVNNDMIYGPVFSDTIPVATSFDLKLETHNGSSRHTVKDTKDSISKFLKEEVFSPEKLNPEITSIILHKGVSIYLSKFTPQEIQHDGFHLICDILVKSHGSIPRAFYKGLQNYLTENKKARKVDIFAKFDLELFLYCIEGALLESKELLGMHLKNLVISSTNPNVKLNLEIDSELSESFYEYFIRGILF